MARAAKTTTKAPAAPKSSTPSLKLVDFQAGNIKELVKSVAPNGNKTVYMVPMDALKIRPGFNLRITDSPEYLAALETLKQSIIEEGFYETKPLGGFVATEADGTDAIVIIDGHRRLAAAKLARDAGADIERLPVILKPATTSAIDLTVSLIKENEGEPLSMLEKAINVRRMLNSGLTNEEVGKRLNFTTRYVSDLLVLVNAPKEVRAMVKQGQVSGTEAVKQLRKAGDNAKAAADKLTEAVKKAEARSGGTKTRATASDTAPVADATVKMTTVVTRYALQKGQTAQYAEVQPFASLFPEDDLPWEPTKPGVIEATEPFEIHIKMRRPKRDAELTEGTEPAEPVTEAAPKKRGRKAAPEPEPVGELVYDPALDGEEAEDEDEEDGEAADLRQLGIVDREAADDL